MAETTTNLGLNVPGDNDFIADEKFFKENLEKIDGAIGPSGGFDSINKKIKGILNIAEYGVIGDGVTSDQTAVVNAVADALAQGKALYWGAGTYLTTANIPNFHKVKHIGDGVVKRGTDLFYVDPIDTRNKIYTKATGGSNLNDGLSASQPIAKVQVAFDSLANYGPILKGYWEIVMTAGTYPFRAELKPGLLSENPIEINGADVGGHPNVPTTILSEGIGIGAAGLEISDGSKLIVRNVKFLGWNGTNSSSGLMGSNHTAIYTENCHFEKCFYGVSSLHAKLDVKGGIFDNCGRVESDGSGSGGAIRSLFLNHHSIGKQNAGDLSYGPIIRNCRYGLFAQESSTGHSDWVTYEDNEDAIILNISSRANADGSSFKRNQRDIRASSCSNIFLTSNNVFGTGADESTNKLILLSGAESPSSNIIDGKSMGNAISERSFDVEYINQSIQSTTRVDYYEAVLKAPLWRYSLSAPFGMGKKLYFKVYGVFNGTNSNKRISARLGTSLVSITNSSTDTGIFEASGEIYFVEPELQYLFLRCDRHLGTVRKSSTIGTNPMTSDTTFSLDAYVDNAADEVHIYMIEIGWAG